MIRWVLVLDKKDGLEPLRNDDGSIKTFESYSDADSARDGRALSVIVAIDIKEPLCYNNIEKACRS